MTADLDHQRMIRALGVGAAARSVSPPNPWLGCVIEAADGSLHLAALPIRGLLFATVSDPYVLVAIQLLDGITATVMSVMVPLTIADLTRGTGRFNLTQGLIGTMMGVGASLSPTLAGYVTDRFGNPAAFSALAAIATIGLVLVALRMPETRPQAALRREMAEP